jgi:LytS/YehU family sensor histidine kinase
LLGPDSPEADFLEAGSPRPDWPEKDWPEKDSLEKDWPEKNSPEKELAHGSRLKTSSDKIEGGPQGPRPKAGRKDAPGEAPRLNAAFLISAVSAIANLAVIEGAWKANRMAILLADHLKSSEAATATDFRPLSEELGDAERYLAIQRLRYGDLLSYRIDSHPSLGELRVPTDSVMPAVERAVICGLAAGGAKLEVLVASRAKGRDIMVEVADNLTEASWPEGDFESLGFRGASEAGSVARRLNSARERLEKLSGVSAGPSFTPSPSGGSVCRLRLPAMALVQAP